MLRKYIGVFTSLFYLLLFLTIGLIKAQKIDGNI